MNRAQLAFAACLSIGGLAASGCGPKEFGSVCDVIPAPAECMTACDPSPGAANDCSAGYHCAPDGHCDAQCTVGGSECGEGYACTSDGYCKDSSGPPEPGIDASCPAINFTPMPTTPSIGLVLDRSGSMDTDIQNGITRYEAMRDALVGTTGVVTQLESKAYFGSQLYTCNGTNLDTIVVPRALNNAAAIRTSIDGTGPGNNTPTHAAIDAMVATFTAMPPPAGSPPVIVLATDGLPNSCDNGGGTTATVAAAAAAYAAGVPLYVLAINQTSSHFQDVANAGQGWMNGQPNVTYYPVTNAAQLEAAFQTIINGVISCDLSLTATIDDAQAMNGTVVVNGVTLTYGSDWTLVGGNVIRLVGQACTDLKNSANPIVSAQFPCGSVIL